MEHGEYFHKKPPWLPFPLGIHYLRVPNLSPHWKIQAVFRCPQQLLREIKLISLENGNLGERFQLQPRPANVQLEACPICLEDSPQLAVQTSCGHHFCGPCFLTLWNDRLLNSVACPLCRQAVTILFPVFTAQELAAATGNNNANEGEVEGRVAQVLDRVNRFNRYNSGRGVPLTDLLRDLPTLIRHFVADLFSPNGFSFVYLARVAIIAVMCAAYLISPLDILPEAVFGVLGFLDDLIVLLLCLIFVVFLYRDIVSRRQFHA